MGLMTHKILVVLGQAAADPEEVGAGRLGLSHQRDLKCRLVAYRHILR